MTDDKKPDMSKLMAGTLAGLLIWPLNTILLVLLLRMTWRWYVQPAFGDGPPDAVWFGILLLHFFITWEHKTPTTEEEKRMETPVAAVLTSFITRWIILWITFAIASLTATIMGWK